MAKYFEFRPGARQRFVTLMSNQRQRILRDYASILVEGWRRIEHDFGLELICWAALPDHMHVVVDTNFGSLKSLAHKYKLVTAELFLELDLAIPRPLWETGVFDQVIDSKLSLDQHIDFVHYNPVKHGLVSKPWDYQQSSFREFVKHGYYFKDWTLDADRRVELKEIDITEFS